MESTKENENMEEFTENIRGWTTVDNEIRAKNAELNALRSQRNEYLVKINNHVKENNMQHTKIELNDSSLEFINVKKAKPLSIKYIEYCLKETLGEEEALTVMEYMLENRPRTETQEIRRKFTDVDSD